jgi:hypothetical protein
MKVSAERLVKLWEVRAKAPMKIWSLVDRALQDLYADNAGMLVTSEEKLTRTLEMSMSCCEMGAVGIITLSTYFTPKLLAKGCEDRG